VHNIDFTCLKESDIDTIIRMVFAKIDEYISIIKPDSNIFISFDGVAPIAKLDQQRQRRYKSYYQNKISRSIMNSANIVKTDPWNTTAITPGTLFMKILNDKVRARYNSPEKYNVKNLILSPSDKFGEGESKIFEFIRSYPEYHSKSNTIIYGLDADLIMLSINHLPISKNIYLFRETPEFIKSINAELDPNECYFIDIPELANIITIDMNNGEELSTEQQQNRIYDYIFMCFFLGNDFMPHFPAINIRTGGVDKMLCAYKSTIGSTNENLTNGKIIYWKNVRKLVAYLANLEEEYFCAEAKLRDRREKFVNMEDKTPEEKHKLFDALPTYDRQMEKYINPFKQGWKKRYYKSLFNMDVEEERKKQICMNYLQGLEWTMKYYTNGCPDWRWHYKYHYPPLLSDLIHYIPYFETDLIEQKPPLPVSELVQLSYVLPKDSLNMLPDNIYNALLMQHGDWYTNECEFVWAYCKYFWESHAELPHIDIDELEGFVNKIVKQT
jgi:5'-3' exonuclease